VSAVTPSPSEQARRILVVQNDAALRNVLANFLSRYFTVEMAATASSALQVLRDRPGSFDLVLAEMHMAPMSGIDLAVAAAALEHPPRVALITAVPVDDALPLLCRHGISNVLTRAMPFDYDDFLIAVENLLYPERAFGLRRYFTHPHEAREVRITDIESRRQGVEQAMEFFGRYRRHDPDHIAIRLALEEIVNNAIYHAFRRADGTERHRMGAFTQLGEGEAVHIEYGRDTRQLGFSVRENCGTLDVGAVLGKIARQASMEGLYDTSGRGLYLTRQMSDRMIINLDPGKRGEVVLLFRHRSTQQPRPLHINVVG
jgi:CheY-like chemotaxis protein